MVYREREREREGGERERESDREREREKERERESDRERQRERWRGKQETLHNKQGLKLTFCFLFERFITLIGFSGPDDKRGRRRETERWGDGERERER